MIYSGNARSAGLRHQKELVRNAIQTMNANTQPIGFSLRSLFVLSIVGGILLSMASLGAKSVTSASCSAPEYHEFDFWLGDWDSFDFGTSKKDARVRVSRILDGCVIHEDYQSVGGHKGESFSIYDASRKVWHQSWVTNRGQLLIIEATYKTAQWFSLAWIAQDPEKSAVFAGVGSRWTVACAKPLSRQPTAARLGSRGSI